LPPNDPLKTKLKDQIGILREWNLRWSTDSVATSLAVFWGTEILRAVGPSPGIPSQDYVRQKQRPLRCLNH
jgi:acyl-homoserine-lactone acylase